MVSLSLIILQNQLQHLAPLQPFPAFPQSLQPLNCSWGTNRLSDMPPPGQQCCPARGLPPESCWGRSARLGMWNVGWSVGYQGSPPTMIWVWYIYIHTYGGFLKWGIPKSSILRGFSIINTNHFGNPPFMETPIYIICQAFFVKICVQNDSKRFAHSNSQMVWVWTSKHNQEPLECNWNTSVCGHQAFWFTNNSLCDHCECWMILAHTYAVCKWKSTCQDATSHLLPMALIPCTVALYSGVAWQILEL